MEYLKIAIIIHLYNFFDVKYTPYLKAFDVEIYSTFFIFTLYVKTKHI